MKKKIMIMIGVLMAVTFTGCGQDAKATDNTVVSDEATVPESTVDDIETESPETIADVAETEPVVELKSTDYGDYVIYDWMESPDDVPLNIDNFVALSDQEYTINKDVPLYIASGTCIGYIKTGATVSPYAGNDETLGVSIPEGSSSLIKKADLDAAIGGVADLGVGNYTADDVRDAIVDFLVNVEGVEINMLDTATADMESSELVKNKKDEFAFDYIWETLKEENLIGIYYNYAVELIAEDDTSYTFKISYSDKIDWEAILKQQTEELKKEHAYYKN